MGSWPVLFFLMYHLFLLNTRGPHHLHRVFCFVSVVARIPTVVGPIGHYTLMIQLHGDLHGDAGDTGACIHTTGGRALLNNWLLVTGCWCRIYFGPARPTEHPPSHHPEVTATHCGILDSPFAPTIGPRRRLDISCG